MIIHRVSLREQIKELLLRRIGDGTLQPGQRIVEGDLTKELNVSNIPVREAIRELTAMSVLESAPHRGAWVREVCLNETIDALHVKSALEAKAALQADCRLQERLDEMRKAITAIIGAALQRDFVAYQEHNQWFHRIIVQASGNQLLLRIWESLAFEIRTRFILDFISGQDPVDIAKEHECIANAIEAGDYEKTAALLAQHANRLVAHLEHDSSQWEQKDRKRNAG